MIEPNLVRIGVDASDDTEYVAVIAGWKADIDNLHHEICTEFGLKAIHMRDLAKKTKDSVIEKLRSASPSSMRLHCFTIKKQSHLSLVLRKKKNYRATHRLYDPVDYCIGIEVTKATSDSLMFFDVHWSEIQAEADNDTEQFLKIAGVSVKSAGSAHQLADAVAWANHKCISLNNVTHGDLVSNIDSRLRKRLRI